MENEEIKVGDIVMHCRSGRVMKVIEIKGECALCQWEEYDVGYDVHYKLSGLRKFIKRTNTETES